MRVAVELELMAITLQFVKPSSRLRCERTHGIVPFDRLKMLEDHETELAAKDAAAESAAAAHAAELAALRTQMAAQVEAMAVQPEAQQLASFEQEQETAAAAAAAAEQMSEDEARSDAEGSTTHNRTVDIEVPDGHVGGDSFTIGT